MRDAGLLDGDVAEFGTYDEENGLRFAAGISPEALRPMLLSRAVYQKGEPSWYVEPIARAGRVYRLDERFSGRPGPRMLTAARIMARAIAGLG